LAVDAAGNVYVSGECVVYRITPSGTVTRAAGRGKDPRDPFNCGFSGDGGLATQAYTDVGPLTFDAAGNLYISARDRVRKVTPGGIITTVAGGGSNFNDGIPATSAYLGPSGIAVDAAGNLYICESGAVLSQIRKVSPQGIITTIAGGRDMGFTGDGGPARSARLWGASRVAVDSAGNLYVSDSNNLRIRKIDTSGVIRTIAGNGLYRYFGDGGPATSAELNLPGSLTTDANGNLYIVDKGNYVIRKVTPAGVISTVAGTGLRDYPYDLPPQQLREFFEPYDLAVDAGGNLYVSSFPNRIVKVTPDGLMTTIAGSFLGALPSAPSPDGTRAVNAVFAASGMTLDARGNLYFANAAHNTVHKIDTAGFFTTVAGIGFSGFSGDSGPARLASLASPTDVAVDGAGNLYIADSFNDRVRKVSPGGTITTFAGGGSNAFLENVPATTVRLPRPLTLTVDTAGNVYVTTVLSVRKITPAGMITTAAGSGSSGFSGDGGLATEAQMQVPGGVATDAAGNLYLSDTDNNRVRKVLAAPPSLAVAPASLAFSVAAGAPPVAAQLLTVSSAAAGLQFTAQASEPWLSLSPAVGAAPAVLSVLVNASALSRGTYRATITIQAPLALPSTQTVGVELTVTRSSAPQLEIEPSWLVVEAGLDAGSPPLQTLRVSNGGSGMLEWTAQSETLGGGGWLSVQRTAGSASNTSPATIPLRVNTTGLRAGVYEGSVEITSPSVPRANPVPVTLLLSQPARTILTTQVAMRFEVSEGVRSPATQRLGILNAGQGAMDWTVEASTLDGGRWLLVSGPGGGPAAGRSMAGSAQIPEVDVRVDPAGLAAGKYTGLLRVDAPGATNTRYFVCVDLEVLSPGVERGAQLRPSQLIFVAAVGGSSPGSQSISLTAPQGSRAIDARGAPVTLDGGSWLEMLPRNVTFAPGEPRSIVVQPRIGSLTPGVYRGAVTLQFDDGSLTRAVEVFFLVSGPGGAAGLASQGAATCTAQQVFAVERRLGKDFAAVTGSLAELDVQVLDDCGAAVSNATVVAAFSNGDPPVTLTSLGNGNYAAAWRPLTPADQATVTIRVSLAPLPPVELHALGRVRSGAQRSLVFPGGIVNGASFAPGTTVAPGSIISVFGQNLASATAPATALPLPTALGGASLSIGGRDVPLFFASAGQLNAQAPFELAAGTRQQAMVRAAGNVSVPETVVVVPAQPGIFLADAQGQGAVFDGQGRLADRNAPAAPGDIVVLYATGLGAVDRAVGSGQASPATPPAVVQIPVAAYVGGAPAVVHFAGLTPGFAGLYQVNLQIPAGVAPGPAVGLFLVQNGARSNTVTMGIR
jgi:uncharacterized protein (TIGR03437 family)